MKARRSLLSRIASAFRRSKPQAKDRKVAKESKIRGIEALEGRIAPASLIDASTIQYKDLDGDIVTIKFSKALFTLTGSIDQIIANNRLDEIFKFSEGTFASDVPQDLKLMDLTKVKLAGTPPKSPVNGISFTIDAVTPSEGTGDGLVKVGQIFANGRNLGNVAIDGDLGQIDVGTPDSKIAIKSLTVNSLFAFGASTQLSTVSATDALESRIVGGVGALQVLGDVKGYFHVLDGAKVVGQSIKVTAPGNIGKVIIGGSLIGDSVNTGTSTDNTGSISAQGNIGTIEVKGIGAELSEKGLIGGNGKNSGTIIANREIGSAIIADSIKGGKGINSGSISAGKILKKLTVGNEVIGGEGGLSGSVQGGSIKFVSIGDSIKGGSGDNSGSVISSGTLTKLLVTNDVVGGTGKFSGNVRVGGIVDVEIGGSLKGGVGPDSGVVFATNDIKSVGIVGNIEGAGGTASGGVLANGVLKSVVVDGDIIGGVGAGSAFIGSQVKIGSVEVNGTITGGEGDISGRIYSARDIDKLFVEKLVGGVGNYSGSILAASELGVGGTIKSAVISLGLEGGVGQSSGTLLSLDNLGRVTIGTKTAAASVTGGEGKFSGSIIAQNSIGKSSGKPSGLLIYGSVTGGTGDQSGLVEAGGNAGLIDIRGEVTGVDGEAGEESGLIRVKGQLKMLDVDGGLTNTSVLVGADLVSAVIGAGITNSTISAFGAVDPKIKTGDIAIGSLTVNGNVSGSQILAGYDVEGNALNADASIKSVRVSGNWTASDLVAGIVATDGEFGDSNDVSIVGDVDRDGYVAKIAKVQILGAVTGSEGPDDHFGFVAEQIDSFKIGNTALALTSASGEVIEVSGTTDVTVREVTT